MEIRITVFGNDGFCSLFFWFYNNEDYWAKKDNWIKRKSMFNVYLICKDVIELIFTPSII